MGRKFRIGLNGGAYGNWFTVEQRKFFVWLTLSEYVQTEDKAKNIIRVMEESEKGKDQ